MRSEKSWIQQIPGWIEATRGVKVPPGVNKEESLRRAHSMRVLLRDGKISTGQLKLDDDLINTFYALCDLLEKPGEESAEDVLHDAETIHRLIAEVPWPDDEFGEREDLMRRCSHVLSLSEGKLQDDHGMESVARWRIPATFPWRGKAPEEGWREAERVLATPVAERREKAGDLRLDDPALLLSICEVLRSRLETTPATVRDEAEFFFGFLENPRRPIGLGDEREFLLGELALTAGGASRVLFRREDSHRWFDRAEANFVLTSDSPRHVARLAYQRLALSVEERRFAEVLELAPRWSESLTRLGLAEDALKCRFLEGVCLRELGEVPASVEVFHQIYLEAEKQKNVRLMAQAANNLALYHRALGDLNESLAYARKALPLLEQLDSRVHLVKLRWCVGDILREQRKLSEAIEAYRAVRLAAEEVGMRGDVASIHLVVADLLLDVGQEREAEREIRAALPIIAEEKMVPEGIAALTLLRESLRTQTVDRTALRELHEHFRNVK
jgi:tetratricopeptide (TPR) repeat protein